MKAIETQKVGALNITAEELNLLNLFADILVQDFFKVMCDGRQTESSNLRPDKPGEAKPILAGQPSPKRQQLGGAQ